MKTRAEKRIEKAILKEITPNTYTVLRALISMYEYFRVLETTGEFSMLIPKDLHKKLGYTISDFYCQVNDLVDRGFLTGKKSTGKGIVVGINFQKLQTYNVGIFRKILNKIGGR